MYTDACKFLEEKLEERKAENNVLLRKEEIIRAFEALREQYGAEEVLGALEDEAFMLFLKSCLTEQDKKEGGKTVSEGVNSEEGAEKEADIKKEQSDDLGEGCVTVESIIKSIHANTTDPKKLFRDIALLMSAVMNSTVATF